MSPSFCLLPFERLRARWERSRPSRSASAGRAAPNRSRDLGVVGEQLTPRTRLARCSSLGSSRCDGAAPRRLLGDSPSTRISPAVGRMMSSSIVSWWSCPRRWDRSRRRPGRWGCRGRCPAGRGRTVALGQAARRDGGGGFVHGRVLPGSRVTTDATISAPSVGVGPTVPGRIGVLVRVSRSLVGARSAPVEGSPLAPRRSRRAFGSRREGAIGQHREVVDVDLEALGVVEPLPGW